MRDAGKKITALAVAGALFLAAILGLSGGLGARTAQAAEYPYLIKVNRQSCVVTIYEKDSDGEYTVPIRAMLCSPGYDTPIGTFHTPEKYRWKILMGDVWGQYSTRINGGVLFHSVWYYSKDPSTLSNKQYNKLGTMCSHGCVRLNVADAKWIYDNCPLGTTVTIYDSSNPGPLGKPKALKVSEDRLMGYDPTDVWSEGNPYLTAKPTISGAKDQKVYYGKSVDLKKGVKAKSATGEDVTDKMKVSVKFGKKSVKKVDTKKAGKYEVTYSYSDASGTATAKATVTVVDNIKPKIYGVKNIYTKEKPDKALAIASVKVKWHGKAMDKDDISVKWKTIGTGDGIKKYKVTYSYTAPNKKSVTASAKVYHDKKAPEISGVKDGTVYTEDQLTEEFLLADVTVEDNYDSMEKEDLTVTWREEKDGTFLAVYRAADKVGNVAEEEARYEVQKGLTLLGARDRVIEVGQVVDEAFAREGVTAYENGADVTDKVAVIITPLVEGYQVVYMVMGSDGVPVLTRVTFTYEGMEPSVAEGD